MKKKIFLSLFFLISCLVFSQGTPNDCSNAITVCGNGSFISNTSGIGNTQEINGNGCGGAEHSSIWLKITIASWVSPGATLGFDLIPNDPKIGEDYEFWVFKGSCPNMTSTPYRCCTSNPGETGAVNNITGMDDSTNATVSGPGNAPPYVRWLNVNPGDVYYICIDNAYGISGFKLNWTGSATTGQGGAFEPPPDANQIQNQETCSTTPNVGIFNLCDLKDKINPDLVNNTVEFYKTVADALAQTNKISSCVYSTNGVINPQTIYARVTDNNSGCYNLTSFNLIVNAYPDAYLDVDKYFICKGDTVVVTYSGTQNATIGYTVNGGPQQITTLAPSFSDPTMGELTISTSPLQDEIYTLDFVQSKDPTGKVICNKPLHSVIKIKVTPLPTAEISAATPICSGSTATISFTGTPNAEVTYKVDGGMDQKITLDNSGNATLVTPVLNADSMYSLVSVTDKASPFCSKNLSESVTVTVSPLPVVSISGTTTACAGTTTVINFVGTANAIVTYTINGGNNQTIVLDGAGAAQLTVSSLSVDLVYSLVSVKLLIAPYCSQPASGTATITVTPLPTTGISGTTTICEGTQTSIAFTGTPNATVFYKVDGGSNQSIILDGTGTNSVTTPILSADSTYTLVSVTSAGPPVCSQNVTGSATVTVKALPTPTISGTTTICAGTKAVITFNGTYAPNGTVTYAVNGTPATLLLDSTGTAILNTPALIATTTYSIVSVSTSGPLVCSQNIAGQSATITTTSAPSIQKPTDYEQCATSTDNAFACTFNLQSKDSEITTDPNVTITYHYTNQSAVNGVNAIPSGLFCNNIKNTQTIYVRAFDPSAPNCPSFTTLLLIVNPRPIPKANVTNLEMCDDNGDGVEDFILTSKDGEIANGQSGVTISYYTTSNAAQDPTNPASVPLTSPYTSGSKPIWFNIKDNLKGCFSVGSFKIVVNPLPKATQPEYPVYSKCDETAPNGFEVFDLNSKVSGILLGQTGMTVTFYPSPADAQNNINAITTLMYQNQIINSQIIGIRITNNTTNCFVTSSMKLEVLPMPTPITPAPYIVCDDNQDGIYSFDLNKLTPEILNGADYTITYYATQGEAQTGNGTALISPYTNTVPFVQIIYAAAVDNITFCRSVVPVELNVEPGPVMPSLQPLTECDDKDNDSQDQTALFNFTGQQNFILAAQLNPGNYTVTFYEDINLTMPIISITDYPGSNNQTIWVTIKDTTHACISDGSFQLVVIAPLPSILLTSLSVCDDDALPNDDYHVFDLTEREDEINQGTGYPVSYYPSLLDAQDGTNVITAPEAYINEMPGSQDVGVAVINPSGCKSIMTLEINVFRIPSPNNPPALPEKCDETAPTGVEVFDLTQNESYIANGDPTLTFHYYYTQPDALAGGTTNEIIPATSVSVGQNVWIRIENNNVDSNGNRCFVVVEQPLKVNPLPFITDPLPPYRACDTDTDGFMTFDLSAQELTTSILGPDQLPVDFTISYYLTASGADPNTVPVETPLPASYTNANPNSQNIYVRVVNNATGCVNHSGILTLVVEQAAFATKPQPFSSCDDYDNYFDGIDLVDLKQPLISDAILNGQDPTIFILSYYHNQADADAGTNAISDPVNYVTAADTDTVWVKVENSSNLIVPACYALTTIDITIERSPNPVINTANGVTSICADFICPDPADPSDPTGLKCVKRTLTLDSGIANPANYTLQWYEDGNPIPGETGSTYTVSTANASGATRNYAVYVKSLTPLACETTSDPFSVRQSGKAHIPQGTLGYTVTNAFAENQTITVLIEGYGTYQYSLDDGPRQDSNVFENVFMGSHTITVWDNTDGVAYSCDELVIPDVQIIDYPRYFTPNGDGFHDTWNIVGLSNQTGAKIYIFDRFGKLLKEISPTGDGWDGTFTGGQMPADDYWFKIKHQENNVIKEFRSHFTLKR